MRVLVAPDAFKESLTPSEAADAIAQGVRRAALHARTPVDVDICPVSDGGDGFLEAIVAAVPCRVMATEVMGPLHEPVTAPWAILEPNDNASPLLRALTAASRSLAYSMLGVPTPSDDLDPRRVAVIESATVCGLHLVPHEARNPERITTVGLGTLISAALEAGCGRVLVGLGGSASVDGGVGAAQALGVRFLDDTYHILHRNKRPLTGEHLLDIARIDLHALDQRLESCELVLACDVDNPLLGPHGAAHVYAPQKGATPQQVEKLERGLEQLARRCADSGLRAAHADPGAGAAGGMAFGMRAMLGARIERGAGIVLEAVDFHQRAARADVVITGEGRVDAQSLRAKAPIEVARAAHEAGAPTLCIAGRIEGDPDALLTSAGGAFDVALAAAPPDMPHDEAMERAPELVADAAEAAFLAWLSVQGRGR